MHKWMFWMVAFTGVANAQTPVVEARGVVNGVTFELAPSTVAPGGIFNIYGFNLATATVAAAAIPLPASLDSPAVEVLVNGRPAPLYFVSPGQINAQAPWETEPGSAQVVVRRSGAASRPATLLVQPVEPSLFALNGAGFGPAIAVRAANGRLAGPDNQPGPGDVLVLYASGLGPVDPAVASGAAGPSNPLATVSRPQRAFVNGLPAPVLFAGLAPGFAGLFQINLQLPDQFAPGDVLQYYSAQRTANRVLLGTVGSPRTRFLPLPEGMDNLVGVAESSLRGGFVALNGPRGADGCYQNVYALDFRRNESVRLEECLTHSNPNAPTPFVVENASAKLAALLGPGRSRVLLLDGATGRTNRIDLPGPALNLLPAGPDTRGLIATLPGDQVRVVAINTDTGEVQTMAAGPAAGALLNINIANVNVDGLTQVVSTPARLGNNRLVAVVADSETNPQRAVFAVLAASGEVVARAAFPAGYLPLLPPRPAAGPPGPGPGGGLGGGVPGGPGGMLLAPRASAQTDPATDRVIVPARSVDNSKHALAIFDAVAATARAADLPAGVFAANCSPQLRLFPLTLAAKLALPVSDRLETAAANPCASTGLVVFDAAGSLQRVALPGSSTWDVNSISLVNDYLYGANADRLSQNASSLFVYDGPTGAMRKLDTPRGATGFAGLQPLGVTGRLLALAAGRVPGDEGLLLFDLAAGVSRLFPTPAGFARLSNPGMHFVTRQLTARGVKAGGESQVVVYDPATGAVGVVDNPSQVQSVGSPAAAAPPARLIWERNQNSNSILGAAFQGDRLTGLVLVEGL